MSLRSGIERLRGAVRAECRAQALLEQARDLDRRAVGLVAAAIEQGRAPDEIGDELLALHHESGRCVRAAVRLATRARGLTADEIEPMPSASLIASSDDELAQEHEDAARALSEWTGCNVTACRAYVDAFARLPWRSMSRRVSR